MTTTVGETFASIWRPVFADGCPAESAAADAWARTQRLFAGEYGAGLSVRQCEEMAGEMALAWLLRAMSPRATAADTELASLAQHAALWLGMLTHDLDRVYEGYYHLLQAWGMYR
jgi:hypothetical protein